MQTHYYKATDGNVTVFRKSGRVYHSAWFQAELGTSGWFVMSNPGLGFSSVRSHLGGHAVSEITKDEYDRLVQLKIKRCAERGSSGSSPQDSWIRNADLPIAPGQLSIATDPSYGVPA